MPFRHDPIPLPELNILETAMNRFTWYSALIISFVFISIIIYSLQIVIFHKEIDTFFYMMQDFAFVPLNVLFVTLILDRLMKKREKITLLNKLNMLIGVFFHETGNGMIQHFKACTTNFNELQEALSVNGQWKTADFQNAANYFKNFKFEINLTPEYLEKLTVYLAGRKESLQGLLKNPTLLEHETFTNLLWAGFHLADELFHRPNFRKLPETDLLHLKGDLIRVYSLIITEWLQYMMHLKTDYPYLFSVAIRTNPFNPNAEITVK